MATVRVRIVILTVRITLSVCPFNRMAHTANNGYYDKCCIKLAEFAKIGKISVNTHIQCCRLREPFCPRGF
jgi:hypothetical protein